MTRNGLQVRPRGPRRPGLEAVGPYLGPGLSLVGLVLVGVISLGLINGRLPSIGGLFPVLGDDGGPIRTPTPSDVIIIDPRSEIPGTIAYVKSGNIWIQSGDRVYRLTNSGLDAMPSWSPDGEWIYFIRYENASGQFVLGGDRKRYALQIPQVMRIRPDSDAQPELLLSGLITRGDQRWSAFIRQPVLSPNLNTLALVSDGPNPLETDVVVQLYDLTTKQLTNPGLDQIRPLGHQDPEWSSDGSTLLFVKNAREGSRGAPMLMRYRLSKNQLTVLAGPGYNSPSWSRDGRFIAATRTDGLGTDIVILDATTGAEVLRVTDDGQSFSATWSPVGDALAYLHIDRGVVDLVTVKLVGVGPDWTIGKTLPLTDAAGLDASSRPSWFVPADELPKPTPTAAPSVTVAPSAPVSPSP